MAAGNGNQRLCLRRGLTFLEVMFAVIILGIGFVMLAAIFPVAIQQQQAALESAQADAILDGATATLRQLAGQDVGNPAPTKGPFVAEPIAVTNVQAFNNPAWLNAIAGSMIDTANPHYAWTALYMRGTISGNPDFKATVLLFALASRNRAAYEPQELVPPTSSSDMEAQPVKVTLTWDTVDNGLNNTIRIEDDGVAGASNAACEGAYVVLVANNPASPLIYRLGTVINPATNTWSISPDADMASNGENTSAASAWIIGRGYRDYTATPPDFSGNCQVIGFRNISITIPTGY